MQITITKENKKRKYNVIRSWNDVTLEKWAKLITSKTKTKSKEALETIKLLSDIPEKILKQLTLNDTAELMKYLSKLQAEENTIFNRIIEIDNKEYGFHPNLELITLGEYADIENYIDAGLQDNLDKVMSVLYRPITEKKNNSYSIEAYDGTKAEVRAEIFKSMKARDVHNSLVFFWILGKELLIRLPSFLLNLKKKVVEQVQKNNLQGSGDGLQ